MASGENTFAKFFLKVVLISGGVAPSVGYRLHGSLFSYVFTSTIVFVLFGDVVGILNETNLHSQVITLLHMVGFLMGLVLHWCIRLNGHRLLRFMDEYFQPNYLDPQVISCTENRFKEISKILIVVYWTFHLNFVGSTFVYAIVGGIQDTKAYLLPTFYKCSSEFRNNTYWISSLCWNIDTIEEYLMVNSFVSVVYLTLILPYWSSFFFYIFAIIYINVNLDVFKRKTAVFSKNLINHARGCNQLSQRKGLAPLSMDRVVHVQMHEVMIYYRKLREALSDISPLLSCLATCNLIIFAIMVSSLLIVILKIPSIGENVVFVVEHGIHVMIFFIYFLLSCVGGETLRNMNMEIASTIYDLPWYNQSVQFQKSIYMFRQLLMIKPLEVTAFQLTVQLRICMVFLQRMYSVLNIIITQM